VLHKGTLLGGWVQNRHDDRDYSGEARLKADYSSIAAERNEVRVKKPPHIYRVLMTIRDAVVGKSDRLTQRSPTTADFQSLFKSNARAFPSVYR